MSMSVEKVDTMWLDCCSAASSAWSRSASDCASIGLFVAVPAVIFYNLLGRRNKVIQDTARHFAVDLEQLFTRNSVKV